MGYKTRDVIVYIKVGDDLPLDFNGGRVIALLLYQSFNFKHMTSNVLSNSKLTSYLVDASINVSF